MVRLLSPALEELHLLVASAAPELAPRTVHARAAVVVFALWRGGGEGFEVWSACGAKRQRRYTSLRRLCRLGWRPDVPTHVRLVLFSRRGGTRRGRGGLVGLLSPAPNGVHLLVALAACGLTPSLAHERAADVVFALWRFRRGGSDDADCSSA